MKASVIQDIIYKVGELIGNPEDLVGFKKKTKSDYVYSLEELNSFIYDLTDQGRQTHIAFTHNSIALSNLEGFLDSITFPVVLFIETFPGEVEPALVHRNTSDALELIIYPSEQTNVYSSASSLLAKLKMHILQENQPGSRHTPIITSFPIKYYSENVSQNDTDEEIKKALPVLCGDCLDFSTLKKKTSGTSIYMLLWSD